MVGQQGGTAPGLMNQARPCWPLRVTWVVQLISGSLWPLQIAPADPGLTRSTGPRARGEGEPATPVFPACLVSANRVSGSSQQQLLNSPSMTLLGHVSLRGQAGSAKGEFPHSTPLSCCDSRAGSSVSFLLPLSHHSNIPFVIFLGPRICEGGPSPPAAKERHLLPTFLLTCHPTPRAPLRLACRSFASCSSPHRSNPTWILNAPIV